MADDSDDDDDSFVTFGTPVEVYEEDAPRKKPVPVHEQVVTDSQGRRRFHGAFSGGFSAGYFNTVGTKEGWSPSTFVSSRSKKNEKMQQKPEDFMDDEDFSEFGIAPKKIATTSEFLATQRQQKRRHLAWDQPSGGVENVVSERKVIPGVPPLQNLVVPAKMTVGVKLLKEMGWREGQGVGPRVRRTTRKKIYGCAAQSVPSAYGKTNDEDDEDDDDVYASGILFAPKDVEDFVFSSKDDFHGLGYKGIDVNTALPVQNVRESNMGMSLTRNYFSKVTGIKGQAFGVGAFEEEDDDIFRTDSMTSYDIELTSESSTRTSDYHGWTGPPKQKEANGLLSIFVVATKPLPARQYFPPPAVPRHYKPSHNIQSSDKQVNIQSKQQADKSHLTVAERGRILGETPLPEPKKSVFDFVTSEDKQRLKSVQEQKQFQLTKSSEVFISCQTRGDKSTFMPFAKDSLKQERYEQYLRIRAGQKDTTQLPDSGLTEWEREREKEEFVRAAVLYRPLSSGMAARFTPAKQPDEPNKLYEEVPVEQESDVSDQAKAAAMKMFGPMTREKFEWHPDRLLCKRFNIPDPYPGSGVAGVPKVRREKFSLQDILTIRTTSTSADSHSPEAVSEKKSESSVEFPPLSSSSSGALSVLQPSVTSLETKSNMLSLTNAENTSGETDKQTTDNKTNNKLLEESEPKKRPPMDLFKAIFADSSSDESKKSDSEEDNAEAADENVRKEAVTSEEAPLPERTMSQLASTSGSVIGQNKEVELPPLQFIPRTKPTVKQGEAEKETLNPDVGEYGPALPLNSKQATLDLSRATIPRKNSFSKADNKKHRKKKRKQKTVREREKDSSDEDDISQVEVKNVKHWTERNIIDVCSDRSDTGSAFKQNKDSLLENCTIGSLKRKSRSKRRTERSRTPTSDGESWKKITDIPSSKSKKSDINSFSSDSCFDSSENEISYRSAESRFDESKKLSSTDKSDSCSREKKQKHKKKKRRHSLDYHEEGQSHYKIKHKKHKKEKDDKDRVPSTEKTQKEPAKQMTVSDNKQILAKLKSIQNLREQKRMRAADFM